ncbi:RPA-related protein RADX isoform X2 [Cynoglossus semilaevis]|uniref:RPA-related protein RADX isoform X2 n=1 Tax=Cynoglossus semilaevis TaxID=244447 RepID=UPI000495C1CA|nr:RPA-related protein RADX-like isoform X2 [Cynoglossus semilaevis]
MAASGCVFHRTLTRVRTGARHHKRNQVSSSSAVCRESVWVVDVHRYTRDEGSSVYFPQSVINGDDLYDLVLSDGDCRLQVTLDPVLNRLVEQNLLRRGSMLRNVTFALTMAAQPPVCPVASRDTDSYKLLTAEVSASDEGGGRRTVDWSDLPWFRSSQTTGHVVPLRANRNLFLPLWNNVDYSGEDWRKAPPTDEEEEEEEEEDSEEALCPDVTVSELRDAFLSGQRAVVRATVCRRLIIRILSKSHLMYYGKADHNRLYPYMALLETCDQTGSVCLVLWASVCVNWYCCLKPGDVISLRHYRVKGKYQAELEDIEISVNSRNPAARISILPESSVSPGYLPPAPTYSFHNSQELMDCPNATVCDVIGLLTFSGRPERIRSRESRGAGLMEYRWLRLEDGASHRPIMVKLFCTSQPETHRHLYPLSVVVCTRLKVVKAAGEAHGRFFLTNTTFTQVYCTGCGDHTQMGYRKLHPVRCFLQWLRLQKDEPVLSRALIGGFFVYPPPPVSLNMYMKECRGKPGFLQGAEIQRDLLQLLYRERRSFCVQARVTMVAFSRRGEEDQSLLWMDTSSPDSPSSSLSSPSVYRHSSHAPPCPALSSSSTQFVPLFISTPHPSRPPVSPSSSSHNSPSCSCSSVVRLTTPPVDHRARSRKRRLLFQTETPKKRCPLATVQPEQCNETVVLFEASMEFLENTDNEDADDEEDCDETASFITAPLPPTISPVATETLPMCYNPTQREKQAEVVGMGGWAEPMRFDSPIKDCYTLKLKVLSDGVTVDAIFLPLSLSSPCCQPLPNHDNSWTSILSHGAFSSHQPPPSPADLINMAAQLSNQRLVCVLEACRLRGGNIEVILSRAFQLPQ